MFAKLEPKFTNRQIRNALIERQNNIENAIQSRLRFVGEEFVNNCRKVKTYKDRTGNLRSSCGYVILKNGIQVEENFRTVKGGTLGVQTARDVVNNIAKRFPRGFVLIGVAGMEYAAAVESRGYDVISNSSIIAESSLRKALIKLQTKIDKL